MEENKKSMEDATQEATQAEQPDVATEPSAASEEKAADGCASETCTEASENSEEGKTCRGEKKKQKKLEAELAQAQKSLEQKDAQLAEEKDKYLRLYAEYDNFRKRSAKELEGRYSDACLDVLTQILPILDNLERAAMYRTDDSAETPLGKGLELTLKSFAETLSKLGVSEIEAQGKPFDPNVHNAVMHIEDESFGENEVVEVLMKGYIRGDKVLRYAMVKVAN